MKTANAMQTANANKTANAKKVTIWDFDWDAPATRNTIQWILLEMVEGTTWLVKNPKLQTTIYCKRITTEHYDILKQWLDGNPEPIRLYGKDAKFKTLQELVDAILTFYTWRANKNYYHLYRTTLTESVRRFLLRGTPLIKFPKGKTNTVH
jgi:hypothetical protein